MTGRRERAQKLGLRAETLAAVWLRLKGYEIIARNVRNAAGEIDIVARRGDVFAFVEVKARPTVEAACDAISVRARRRIATAAEVWAGHDRRYRGQGMRFDLIAIRPRRLPVHLRDAWRPDFAATDV